MGSEKKKKNSVCVCVKRKQIDVELHTSISSHIHSGKSFKSKQTNFVAVH